MNFNYFKKEESNIAYCNPTELECSICWGFQQFDGKCREMVKDEQISVNNHAEKYSFIQQFVIDNITGAHLKNEIH